MIYWRDTFSIIKKFLPADNQEVAAKLNISLSTLSNIKAGRRNCTIPLDSIYKNIFDLNNKESLASLKNQENKKAFQLETNNHAVYRRERNLLNFLRQIISEKFRSIEDELKDLWNENDYETFVMTLLRRTRNGSRKSKSESSDDSEKIVFTPETPTDGPSEQMPEQSDEWDVQLVSTRVVRMPYEFFKCYEDCAIEGFINLNPVDMFVINYMTASEKPNGSGLIKNAMQFVEHMEDVLSNTKISTSNERICKEIATYAKALREYICFLQEYSATSDSVPFMLDPVYGKCCEKCEQFDECFSRCDCKAANEVIAEFEREATEYRDNLRSQYKKVDDCLDHSLDQFKMYSGFNTSIYRLKVEDS